MTNSGNITKQNRTKPFDITPGGRRSYNQGKGADNGVQSPSYSLHTDRVQRRYTDWGWAKVPPSDRNITRASGSLMICLNILNVGEVEMSFSENP